MLLLDTKVETMNFDTIAKKYKDAGDKKNSGTVHPKLKEGQDSKDLWEKDIVKLGSKLISVATDLERCVNFSCDTPLLSQKFDFRNTNFNGLNGDIFIAWVKSHNWTINRFGNFHKNEYRLIIKPRSVSLWIKRNVGGDWIKLSSQHFSNLSIVNGQIIGLKYLPC